MEILHILYSEGKNAPSHVKLKHSVHKAAGNLYEFENLALTFNLVLIFILPQ